MIKLTPTKIVTTWEALTERLRAMGEAVPPLLLRAILGWEFFEAGLEKYRGENWFTDIHTQFPLPFNQVPAPISWTMATWFELIGAVMLWLGLGTRFFAFGLLVLTSVATAAVHWPSMFSSLSELWQGYAITNQGFGNFKLPLLFAVMLLPLIFNGAGKLSLDHLIGQRVGLSQSEATVIDAKTVALTGAVLAIPFLFLVPMLGFGLIGIAILALLFDRFVQ